MATMRLAFALLPVPDPRCCGKRWGRNEEAQLGRGVLVPRKLEFELESRRVILSLKFIIKYAHEQELVSGHLVLAFVLWFRSSVLHDRGFVPR
ncbi:hypothetical protein LINGRAHAP2_LOCUS31935 [Linum grandiflorum]